MSNWEEFPWDEFVKGAIGASVLGEYWYCAPKLVVKQKIGEIQTPQTIAGAHLHEEEAQRILAELGPLHRIEKPKTIRDAMKHSLINLWGSLQRKEMLANGEHEILFRTIIPELGIIGIPDKADCTSGKQPVIIESKYVNEIPRGPRPWPSDEVQVATYMMGLEALSFKPTNAVLEYIQRSDNARKAFRIQLTDALRHKVMETVEKVRKLLNGQEAPIPPSRSTKCQACDETIRKNCSWCLLKR